MPKPKPCHFCGHPDCPECNPPSPYLKQRDSTYKRILAGSPEIQISIDAILTSKALSEHQRRDLFKSAILLAYHSGRIDEATK